ncbi:hypothetical protein [Burkholderia ubonensis]|uniref:hypothetical protein n=1 Tax=Burkholderia ubonensis TaxID=101571 RepID=UPI000A53A2F2|nr:hypothetical protein [Burkholderia ubonensis]
MGERKYVAFNLGPDGSIVFDGQYGPGVSGAFAFSDIGIESERTDVGRYRVTGPVAKPEGWRMSIFCDDDGEPTLQVALEYGDDAVDITCKDPKTDEPKDIVFLLTLRLSVTREFEGVRDAY